MRSNKDNFVKEDGLLGPVDDKSLSFYCERPISGKALKKVSSGFADIRVEVIVYKSAAIRAFEHKYVCVKDVDDNDEFNRVFITILWDPGFAKKHYRWLTEERFRLIRKLKRYKPYSKRIKG